MSNRLLSYVVIAADDMQPRDTAAEATAQLKKLKKGGAAAAGVGARGPWGDSTAPYAKPGGGSQPGPPINRCSYGWASTRCAGCAALPGNIVYQCFAYSALLMCSSADGHVAPATLDDNPAPHQAATADVIETFRMHRQLTEQRHDLAKAAAAALVANIPKPHTSARGASPVHTRSSRRALQRVEQHPAAAQAAGAPQADVPRPPPQQQQQPQQQAVLRSSEAAPAAPPAAPPRCRPCRL